MVSLVAVDSRLIQSRRAMCHSSSGGVFLKGWGAHILLQLESWTSLSGVEPCLFISLLYKLLGLNMFELLFSAHSH